MRKLLDWVKENRLASAVVVLSLSLAVASAIDSIGARRAAGRYFGIIKGWAKAYDRDTTAAKKEFERTVKPLITERDSYKKKWEDAKGKMETPWIPPKGAKALQERFNKLGYRGTLK